MFDARKKLVAIFSTPAVAAQILSVSDSRIYQLCDGNGMSLHTKKVYLRWWDREIIIDVLKEIGVLTLHEYDKLYGENRKVYANSKMIYSRSFE